MFIYIVPIFYGSLIILLHWDLKFPFFNCIYGVPGTSNCIWEIDLFLICFECVLDLNWLRINYRIKYVFLTLPREGNDFHGKAESAV